jgi:hypothetical protein
MSSRIIAGFFCMPQFLEVSEMAGKCSEWILNFGMVLGLSTLE